MCACLVFCISSAPLVSTFLPYHCDVGRCLSTPSVHNVHLCRAWTHASVVPGALTKSIEAPCSTHQPQSKHFILPNIGHEVLLSPPSKVTCFSSHTHAYDMIMISNISVDRFSHLADQLWISPTNYCCGAQRQGYCPIILTVDTIPRSVGLGYSSFRWLVILSCRVMAKVVYSTYSSGYAIDPMNYSYIGLFFVVGESFHEILMLPVVIRSLRS